MKRIAAWLTAIALCFLLLPAPVGAVGEVYFVSINDHLLPLSADTMPTWINGVLYVPVPAFKSAAVGFSLGLYCSQSRDGGTATLYNLRQMLVFDLNAGNSLNHHTGEIYQDQAIRRSGRVFLPLAAVCEFFQLEYSYHYTQFGVLVRIKNEYAALKDESFIDAASTMMRDDLKEYMLGQAGQTPDNPGSDNPPDSHKPPGTILPEAKVKLCLAFRDQTTEELTAILDRLDQSGVQGLFLLSEEELLQQDDLVRRIVGSGHCIGFQVQGKTVQESRESLEQCNRLLAHAARTAATVVEVPEDQRELLRKEGWICWSENSQLQQSEEESAEEYAQRLEQAMADLQDIVCLTLDNSTDVPEVLHELLESMGQGKYTFIAPLETRL